MRERGLSVLLEAPPRENSKAFFEEFDRVKEFLEGMEWPSEFLMFSRLRLPGVQSECLKRPRLRMIVEDGPRCLIKAIETARFTYFWALRPDTFIPPKEVSKLIPWLDKGYEVVVGSRFVPRESIIQKRVAPIYVFQERLLNVFLRFFFHRGLTDYTAGCYVFTEGAWEKSSRGGLQRIPMNLESLLLNLTQPGLRVKEKGLMWIPLTPSGYSFRHHVPRTFERFSAKP